MSWRRVPLLMISALTIFLFRRRKKASGAFTHKEDTVKAGDRYLSFLKTEIDRQNARARLFESRSQIMATFAGAGGTLAALTKPTDGNLLYIIFLGATALATLVAIGYALAVHVNQDISLTDIKWLKKVPNRIWEEKEDPMVLIHELELSQLEDLNHAIILADSKGKRVKTLQLIMVVQLFAVAVTIITAAVLGGTYELKAAPTTAPTNPSTQSAPK